VSIAQIGELVFRLIIFGLGLLLALSVIVSAIRTFVLPRSARDWLTSSVFRYSRRIFAIFTSKATTYEQRDEVMALYAPVTLTVLPVIWLSFVMIGYTAMYWAIGVNPLETAFVLSGSSLLTLGFEHQEGILPTILVFSEAMIGLILIALLIAYLPTIYGAFSRREALVTHLEVRAGTPPSAVEMFARFKRLHRFEKLGELWTLWENFFVDIEESHTSLAALAFFRSPQPHRSWVTAAGAVLDAASLAVSTVDIPHDVQADLTIRAGYLALRHIADFFGFEYNKDPRPTDPISISRLEFDIALNQMAEQGVPIKADRDQAWKDFRGWRVNYDTVLLQLCAITMAPYAPWSSDRSLRRQRMRRTGFVGLQQRLLRRGKATVRPAGKRLDVIMGSDLTHED
jgi:hypothetical protein